MPGPTRDSRQPRRWWEHDGAEPGTIRGLLTLLVVAVFQAVTAIAGGVAMIATDGLGMPAALLASGPFPSFIGPALILLFVVGGTQTAAAVLLILRRDIGLLWSAVAGFGMLIWIFVETILIAGSSWLQWLYFCTAIGQLVLVLALTGIAKGLPREPLARRVDRPTVRIGTEEGR